MNTGSKKNICKKKSEIRINACRGADSENYQNHCCSFKKYITKHNIISYYLANHKAKLLFKKKHQR